MAFFISRSFWYHIFLLGLISYGCYGCGAKKEKKEIDIMLFGNHPLLKNVQLGIKEAFIKRLLDDGKDSTMYHFQVFEAGFKPSNAIQQTKIALEQQPAAMVSLGTPSISAMLSQNRGQIPMFFGATNDAGKLELTAETNMKDWQKISLSSDPNVYGYVSAFDFTNMANLILQVSKLQGKNNYIVGYPITSTESNSKIAFTILEEKLKTQGFTLLESPISNANETMRAARDLMNRKVGIIQIGPDNTVVGGLSSILSATEGYGISVLAADRESVSKGSMCAVGIDFVTLGHNLGNLLYDVLEKQINPTTKVAWFSTNKLFLNHIEITKQFGNNGLDSLKRFASTHQLVAEPVH